MATGHYYLLIMFALYFVKRAVFSIKFHGVKSTKESYYVLDGGF